MQTKICTWLEHSYRRQSMSLVLKNGFDKMPLLWVNLKPQLLYQVLVDASSFDLIRTDHKLKDNVLLFFGELTIFFLEQNHMSNLQLRMEIFIYRCNHVRLAHTRGVDAGRRQIIGEQCQINYFVLLSTNTLYLINR